MGLFVKLLQKVVKNEAMAADPPEIYGWRVFLLACSACFGAMTFGWDIGAIGGIITLTPFMNDYGLTTASPDYRADLSANIVSTLQAGCFLGCIVAAWYIEKFGRKIGLITSAIWVIVGVIFQGAASGSLAVLYIGRFIAGVGVGAASMIVPVYISENAPRAIRGGLTGLYQLFIATGTMMAFWINYGAALHLTGKAEYIAPLVCQAIPPVCLLVGILMCHESPRWLARKDNWEKAREILSIVTTLPPDHPYIETEISEMYNQLEMERRIVGGASFKDLQKEMWTIPGNRKRAFIVVALMICQQMTGTNAINYYAPTIFKDLGLSGTNASLFATGIYGIVKMTTCATFLLLAADSLGRRRSLLWTAIAQAVCMFIIGAYVKTEPPVSGQPISGFGYFALVCIFLFASFYQFGWGPVPWIYSSEIPSARLRGETVAIAAATQWLFNFVVARAVPSMLINLGKAGYGTYFFFGSFCAIMFPFTWFFIPETKGLRLEHMDKLFGVTQLAEKLNDEEHEVGVAPTTIDDKPTATHREEVATA